MAMTPEAPMMSRVPKLRRAAAIEIKIGQGTKPGMGGHLPGEKVTAEIAALRGKPVGEDIHSPSRFPGIESPGDLRALVSQLRDRSQGRPIGVKIAAGHLEEDLAFLAFCGTAPACPPSTPCTGPAGSWTATGWRWSW